MTGSSVIGWTRAPTSREPIPRAVWRIAAVVAFGAFTGALPVGAEHAFHTAFWRRGALAPATGRRRP
jgi:hypothetical protein